MTSPSLSSERNRSNINMRPGSVRHFKRRHRAEREKQYFRLMEGDLSDRKAVCSAPALLRRAGPWRCPSARRLSAVVALVLGSGWGDRCGPRIALRGAEASARLSRAGGLRHRSKASGKDPQPTDESRKRRFRRERDRAARGCAVQADLGRGRRPSAPPLRQRFCIAPRSGQWTASRSSMSSNSCGRRGIHLHASACSRR